MQLTRELLALTAIRIKGDIGPLTVYRRCKQRLVAYLKTWPDKPPTPAQQKYRDLATDAAAAWRALPETKRAQWRLAARRASLRLTGYNLWLGNYIYPDIPAIQTLEHQTNTSLL